VRVLCCAQEEKHQYAFRLDLKAAAMFSF
jgi:hypothetical protein